MGSAASHGGFLSDSKSADAVGAGSSRMKGMFKAVRRSVKGVFGSGTGEIKMKSSSFVVDPSVLPVAGYIGSVPLGEDLELEEERK